MKHITAISLLTLASLVTISSALAQDSGVQATVPFNFTVGNTVLPSGTYTITSESPNMILLRNKDTRHAMMALALPDSKASARGKLVFDKYANQYFLTEILCPNTAVNVSFPHSKLEKRAQMQEANLRTEHQVFLALK